MSDTRYYYLNKDSKTIKHTASVLDPIPEGFEFCGLSQLPVKGAAGYYAKNQQGFTVVNGDEIDSETPNNENSGNNISED